MRNWNRKTSSSKLSSVSISFSTAAKGNFNHNRRTLSKVPENVDPTRTAFNKILIDKDIRQVYKEVFGEALAEYNANQVAKKHPERQKKDYYSSICHDKKTEPFREAVVQIGNKDKQIPRWESNEILQKFLKKFQENNPQLVVVGAYIHNDEATPHMHIDYVPVATYSKGLKKRVANDKALNQMGYKTWNDWKDSQMTCLENLVREKGYDREYMNNSNRHIADVEKFKRVQKEVERLANNKLEKMELPDIPEDVLSTFETYCIKDGVSYAMNETKDELYAINSSLSDHDINTLLKSAINKHEFDAGDQVYLYADDDELHYHLEELFDQYLDAPDDFDFVSEEFESGLEQYQDEIGKNEMEL